MNAIPNNYFAILYIVLYLLSPYINKLIDSLDRKQFKKLIFILFTIFSIYPTLVDAIQEICNEEFLGLSSIGAYGSQDGYTIVNFILLYLIGAFIRKTNYKITFYVLIICILAMLIGYIQGIYSLVEYCSPLVIIESICLFSIFSNMHIKKYKIITKLSEASFTSFLIHMYLITKTHIQFHVNQGTIIMILHVFVTSFSIVLISYLINYIYKKVESFIFKKY